MPNASSGRIDNKSTLDGSHQRPAPFLVALRVQRRVLGALMMREVLTRYGRHNVGFLWLFGEPMIFTLGIALIWSLSKNVHNDGITPASFALTGYTSVLLWRNSVGRAQKAIEINLALLYHRNVKMFDIVLSRILLEIIGAITSFFVLMFVFNAFGLCPLPADWVMLCSGFLLHSIFSICLALAVGGLSETTELVDRLWHAFAYFLLPFSGAPFMVEWLPQGLQKIAVQIPMVSGIEMIRGGLYGSLVVPHSEPVAVLGWSAALLFYALIQFRSLQRTMEPS
jgi:capsular polysaccharide transport system permease protein